MNISFLLLQASNIGPEDYTLAVVGYVIVIVSLFVLVGIFLGLPHLVHFNAKRLMRKKGVEVPEGAIIKNITGEENAAVSVALYLFINEIHDDESNIITIKKIAKSYSPWSSKIYGLNSLDRKW